MGAYLTPVPNAVVDGRSGIRPSLLPNRISTTPLNLQRPRRAARSIYCGGSFEANPAMPSLSLASLRGDHPAQIAARTYALSLSLSLAPPLFSIIASRKAHAGRCKALKHLLARELGWTGFAFAMSVGVGGGAAFRRWWNDLEEAITERGSTGENQTVTNHKPRYFRLLSYAATLPDPAKSFVANALSAALAFSLLQGKKRRRSNQASPTLDLTLLFFVRAMDSVVRSVVLPSSNPRSAGRTENDATNTRKKRHRWTRRLDALVFWACSARIMWCFFYEPNSLPRSYNKWIMSLANIDRRILGALRAIRSGELSYRRGHVQPPDLVSSLSGDLGYPVSWGDLSRIPAYGGPKSTPQWRDIGVTSRDGLGGIPCELVHGGVTGSSCVTNASLRGLHAFLEAAAIYLPVHFLPRLLAAPHEFLSPSAMLGTLIAVFRSSAFLSTFVSSVWISVCLTRTLLFARLFPNISHDFWDGPYGCTYVGSLICGASIWIEQGRRRGEMALYVLPRALRTCLSESWVRSGKKRVTLIERVVFILSLATLLTASAHRADSLRGLSRWTLSFVMRGPGGRSSERKRGEPNSSHAIPENGTPKEVPANN